MVDNANATQKQLSAAIDSGDDFSHKSIQAIDNYDNFGQTIMALEASQSKDSLNRVAQCMIVIVIGSDSDRAWTAD